MMINQFLLSVENFLYRHYSQLSPSKRHLSGVPLYAGNRWTLVRDFTVFECLRLRMHKVDWNRVGEWKQVFKLKSQRHNVRFFLILVSLFYVEVSVTRPVFHIWYCTRGFLFRLKIVLPPSWSSYCVPGLLFGIHNT